MNEKSSKRRDWVKNAAIVFLSVLLVLTFFSSTIMNYSLPEVATKYVEPGTITAKIRGTGMVESGDPYSVRLKTTAASNATGVYEVASVDVKRGDVVGEGTVLCTLAEKDSKPLQDAKDALNSQLLQYEISILQGNTSNSVLNNAQSGNISSMSTYQAKLLAKENEINDLKTQVEDAENMLAIWEIQRGASADVSSEKDALSKAQDAYDSIAAIVQQADQQIAPWQAMIEESQAVIDKKDLVASVSGSDVTYVVSEEEVTVAILNIATAQEKINQINTQTVIDARAALPDLRAQVEKAQNALDNKPAAASSNAEEQVRNWTKEVASRQKKVTEAEAEKAQMITDIVTELQWGDTLSKLQENIAALEGEKVGGEVVAPISGTIIDVRVKSGEETPSDGILFTMQPEGKGYTMQFSVTNEQAKRLSVGDMADIVNSWRYDNVEVKLASIKPDPSNPGQNKQLTFDVTGNLTAGQSLSVSVGQKSANFDCIVPNSAIREDNNGKFILIIETKSTPLNNRYIASRVDVEVLASDDTKSAVSGALNGYEYVITTATAPVEAGKQVRLSDN